MIEIAKFRCMPCLCDAEAGSFIFQFSVQLLDHTFYLHKPDVSTILSRPVCFSLKQLTTFNTLPPWYFVHLDSRVLFVCQLTITVTDFRDGRRHAAMLCHHARSWPRFYLCFYLFILHNAYSSVRRKTTKPTAVDVSSGVMPRRNTWQRALDAKGWQ